MEGRYAKNLVDDMKSGPYDLGAAFDGDAGTYAVSCSSVVHS